MALPEIETERLRLVIAQPGLEEALARFYQENFAGHLDRWSPPMPADKFDRGVLGATAAGVRGRVRCRHDGALGPARARRRRARSRRDLQLHADRARAPSAPACWATRSRAPTRAAASCTRRSTATIDYAFRELRLHRIMANYRPENGRSGRLLERLGFVREGYARDYLFIDGAWRDHVLTSKTNPHFDAAWLRG